MILVAWQNMLSPHQAPLLNGLSNRAEIDTVYLIVEQAISAQRAAMGWQIPDMPKVEIVVAPSIEQLDRLKPKLKNATHLVSGFAQGRYGDWIHENIPHFFLYTELAKSDSVWRSWINQYRYKRFYKKIQHQVKGIFAIGAQCPIWLEQTLGIETEKILPFGYFLDAASIELNATEQASQNGALFVGRLEPVKGIEELVDAYIQAKAKWPLTIVGEGSLSETIRAKVTNAETIKLLGSLSQLDILAMLKDYQCLLLPNQKEEGWGFVVNEALMKGTPVLCSELTGARNVVNNAPGCQLLRASDVGQFISAVDKHLRRGWSAQQRVELQTWYNQQLSVDVAVNYMIQMMGADGSKVEHRGNYGWQ